MKSMLEPLVNLNALSNGCLTRIKIWIERLKVGNTNLKLTANPCYRVT